MKRMTLAMVMVVMTSAYATIEYDGNDGKPTTAELQKSRACFEELSQNGCGDPGDDLKHFRTCMHDSFSKLSTECRSMMTRLYKRKN